jgi:O-antigen/teichoic acid export membrane protein
MISNRIRGRDVKKFPVLLQKIKQISVHKLGTFVSTSTDNILIFKYISIESVAFYGNYMLIVNNLTALIMKLFSGTNASVGNLVAENDPENIKKVFWEFMALRFFIACFSTIAILKLLDPFIALWLGPEYVLDHSILIFFSINFFILQIRQPVDVFIQAYGLYQDTWSPIAESIINLVFSLILIRLYGIAGVLMGTTISLIIIIMIWRPYFVFTQGFKRGINEYVKGFSSLAISAILTWISVNYLTEQFYNITIENWIQWLLIGVKVIVFTAVINFIIMFCLNKGFRDVTKRITKLMIK